MYPNFNAERARSGIPLEEIARSTGQSVNSVSAKLRGKYRLTFADAIAYRNAINSIMPLDILFKADKSGGS